MVFAIIFKTSAIHLTIFMSFITEKLGTNSSLLPLYTLRNLKCMGTERWIEELVFKKYF